LQVFCAPDPSPIPP